MPGMDGYEVCRRLKASPATCEIPTIFLTGRTEAADEQKGFEVGAVDYIHKPFSAPIVLARVKTHLALQNALHTVQAQSAKLAEWNAKLEERVNEQVSQLEGLSRLRRFFSPQLAEAILTGGASDPLASHRREVVVVFLDLRGFTAFAESSEPEEVMRVLREYHAEMGKLILEYEGTLERFTGDGIMIFFNDPVVIPNPAERALRMAVAMRERVNEMSIGWRKHGYDLSLGIGVAQGYATIGAIENHFFARTVARSYFRSRDRRAAMSAMHLRAATKSYLPTSSLRVSISAPVSTRDKLGRAWTANLAAAPS